MLLFVCRSLNSFNVHLFIVLFFLSPLCPSHQYNTRLDVLLMFLFVLFVPFSFFHMAVMVVHLVVLFILSLLVKNVASLVFRPNVAWICSSNCEWFQHDLSGLLSPFLFSLTYFFRSVLVVVVFFFDKMTSMLQDSHRLWHFQWTRIYLYICVCLCVCVSI